MAITVAHGVNTIGASFAAGVGNAQQRQNELAAKQREAELERVARQRAQQQQMQFTAQRDLFGAQQQTLRDQRLFGQQAQRDQQIFDQQAQRDERLFGQQTQRDELEAKRAQDRLDSEWGYRTKQQDGGFANDVVRDRIKWLQKQADKWSAMRETLDPIGRGKFDKLMNDRKAMDAPSGEMLPKDYMALLEQNNQSLEDARLGDHIMVDPAKAKAEYDADYTRRTQEYKGRQEWQKNRAQLRRDLSKETQTVTMYGKDGESKEQTINLYTPEEINQILDESFGAEYAPPAYEFPGVQQPQAPSQPAPQQQSQSLPSGLPSGLDINSLPRVSPEDLQGLPGGSYFRIPDAYGGGIGQVPMQQQPSQQKTPASQASSQPSGPPVSRSGNWQNQLIPIGVNGGGDFYHDPSSNKFFELKRNGYEEVNNQNRDAYLRNRMSKRQEYQQPTRHGEQLPPYQQTTQYNPQPYEQENQRSWQAFSGQQGYGDAASRQDAMIKQVIRGGGFDQSNSRGTGDGKPQWSLNTERPKGHGFRFSDMEIAIRDRVENGIPLTEEMERWIEYSGKNQISYE